MKFLVIGRPNGQASGVEPSKEGLFSFSNQLVGIVGSETIESAYALISGGYAFIINAKDTEELTMIVRSNPLFKSSHTEIIPIAHAVDFLEAFASY